jgi:hypothetical protein
MEESSCSSFPFHFLRRRRKFLLAAEWIKKLFLSFFYSKLLSKSNRVDLGDPATTFSKPKTIFEKNFTIFFARKKIQDWILWISFEKTFRFENISPDEVTKDLKKV